MNKNFHYYIEWNGVKGAPPAIDMPNQTCTMRAISMTDYEIDAIITDWFNHFDGNKERLTHITKYAKQLEESGMGPSQFMFYF